MAFNMFPYTDFQNLNFDWILQRLGLLDTITSATEEAKAAATAAQASAAAAAAQASTAAASAAQATETAQQALDTASGIIGLPAVTAAQAGFFARVNDSGVWTAEAVPQAETEVF